MARDDDLEEDGLEEDEDLEEEDLEDEDLDDLEEDLDVLEIEEVDDEDLPEVDLELDDDLVDEEDEDEPDEEDEAEPDEDESLDQLLARRSAARRPGQEVDDEEGISLPDPEPRVKGSAVATAVIPVKDRQEFVCTRCHLVKKRSQLADPDRILCRDCV